MKKAVVLAVVLAASVSTAADMPPAKDPPAKAAAKVSGEASFKQYCAACHAGGGNIVNPKKTLHKKDREAHGIKTAADIVHLMRHPGPGMPTFDEKTIPDAEAKAIAAYEIATFK